MQHCGRTGAGDLQRGTYGIACKQRLEHIRRQSRPNPNAQDRLRHIAHVPVAVDASTPIDDANAHKPRHGPRDCNRGSRVLLHVTASLGTASTLTKNAGNPDLDIAVALVLRGRIRGMDANKIEGLIGLISVFAANVVIARGMGGIRYRALDGAVRGHREGNG